MNIEILREAFDIYGEEKQMLKAVEELNELAVEIMKNVNKDLQNEDAIIDEMADVSIMLEYLKFIFDPIGEKISERIYFKIKRLEDRIKEEKIKKLDDDIQF